MSDHQNDISIKYEDLLNVFLNKVENDVKKLYIEGEHITRKNIILIVDLLMKEAGKLQNLVGVEKKILVIKSVEKIVNQEIQKLKDKLEEIDDTHQEEWNKLQVFVDDNIDPLIDQMFSLAPQAYGKLVKITTNTRKWWQKVSCCK